MGPLNQNPRLQSAPPHSPSNLSTFPCRLLRGGGGDIKHRAFLLIMDHSRGQAQGKGFLGPRV